MARQGEFYAQLKSRVAGIVRHRSNPCGSRYRHWPRKRIKLAITGKSETCQSLESVFSLWVKWPFTGRQRSTASAKSTTSLRYDSQWRLQIDVSYDCSQAAPATALKASGMVIDTSVKAPPLCIVEGWAALASIPSLVDAPAVMKIGLPRYAKHHPRSTRAQFLNKRHGKRATVNGGPLLMAMVSR